MGVEEGRAKEQVERLREKFDGDDGRFSRYLVATDNPAYKRAFPKLLSATPTALSREEIAAVGQVQAAARSLSLTGASGGFAVPFTLDPTIIPTSNHAVNPFRAIARVEQIVTDDWNGVTSAGVSASWDAEGAEVSDDSPTLAQPSVSVHKAAAFVPFSIEIGQDWSGLQAEMAAAIQDAKDELEATAFANGTGSGQPQGITVGATATIAEASGGTFAAADVYALETALPPRFRPMASFVANRAQYQRVRQFDTAGGAQLWIDNLRLGLTNGVPTPGNVGASLLGYGAYESSAMISTATTSSGKILVLGDFRYYLIADRVGLSLEYIPHLFHTSNNRPSGSRGIYAYWRTGAGVLSTNAFRVLEM
jgi:HK97 family phage major capsid protein